ncbi:hypothetical protein OBV_40100 [Oscillibacter valericigenes Sjm18-20]|nr:hypothetical protein OBV_40100 [Oscillibacter valericigenes Sjm18-20]
MAISLQGGPSGPQYLRRNVRRRAPLPSQHLQYRAERKAPSMSERTKSDLLCTGFL